MDDFIYLGGIIISLLFGITAVISLCLNRRKHTNGQLILYTLSTFFIIVFSCLGAIKVYSRQESLALSFIDMERSALIMRVTLFQITNILFFVLLILCAVLLFFADSKKGKRIFLISAAVYVIVLLVCKFITRFDIFLIQANYNADIALIFLMFAVFEKDSFKKTSIVIISAVTISSLISRTLFFVTSIRFEIIAIYLMYAALYLLPSILLYSIIAKNKNKDRIDKISHNYSS